MSGGLGYKTPANKTKSPGLRRQQIWPNRPLLDTNAYVANADDAMEMSAVAPTWKTHADVLKFNTGWALDPVVWAKRARASQRKTLETEYIASALMRAGIKVYRDSDVTRISAVTGIVERQRNYRSVCILPEIAARERGSMMNELKLFMSEHKNKRFFRYAVFTCAAPIPVGGDLRGAIQELSRRISKWSCQVKKRGVKVLFRGMEFTRKTAEERGMMDHHARDTVLYHVHANVIYWPTRAMKTHEWTDFLKDTRVFMGAEWKDNRKVERVEDIVRYCMKPNDTKAASDDELVWLYYQTAKLKIHQPLGDFKAWRRCLKERGEKVAHVHVGQGDGRFMRVQKLRRKKTDEVDQTLKPGFNPSGEDVDNDAPLMEPAPKVNPSKPIANILLGMTLPQWRHSPWAEPMIMVQHYDPARASGDLECDIEVLRQQAREWWDAAAAPQPDEALRVARMALEATMSDEELREAAEAAPYSVHICRPTVPDIESELDSISYIQDGEPIFQQQESPPPPSIDEIMEAPNTMYRLQVIADQADQRRREFEKYLRTLPREYENKGREFVEREFSTGVSTIVALLANAANSPIDEDLAAILDMIKDLSAAQIAA